MTTKKIIFIITVILISLISVTLLFNSRQNLLSVLFIGILISIFIIEDMIIKRIYFKHHDNWILLEKPSCMILKIDYGNEKPDRAGFKRRKLTSKILFSTPDWIHIDFYLKFLVWVDRILIAILLLAILLGVFVNS